MFEIGDRVVCIETLGYGGLTVGKVYTVDSLWNPGIWVVDDKGGLVGMCSEYFKPYTETEAERRGAKFGVMGIYKPTGKRAIVVSTSKVSTPDPFPGQERWIVCIEGSIATHEVYASNIRLDHEPEFVAWVDAPEHLKYDASRVYYGGKPVKWIAKPEGAFHTDVVFTTQDGFILALSDYLTVKL